MSSKVSSLLEVNVKQTHYSFVTVYDTFWIVARNTFLITVTNKRTGFGSGVTKEDRDYMALANQRPVFTVSTNEEADGDDGDHGGIGPVMGNISVLY